MQIESLHVPLPRVTRRRLRTGAIALAVCALFGTLVWRSRPGVAPHSAASASGRAPVATLPATPVASLPPMATPPAAPSVISARLQREFVESTNLYAFAENARRRPREGGILYAEAASSYCRYATERFERTIAEFGDVAIAEAGPVDARRVAVLDRYARRCAGFRQLDVDAYWRDLDRSAASDPLIDAGKALSRASLAGDVDGRVAATQHLVDLHDPLLYSRKWAYLMNPDRVANAPPGGLWFEGHDYRPVDEYGRYVEALQLAGCRTDAPCGSDDLTILACRVRGVCRDSINADPFPDVATRDVAARQRYWNDVLALTGRMREALGRGDLDAFRAPRVGRQ